MLQYVTVIRHSDSGSAQRVLSARSPAVGEGKDDNGTDTFDMNALASRKSKWGLEHYSLAQVSMKGARCSSRTSR